MTNLDSIFKSRDITLPTKVKAFRYWIVKFPAEFNLDLGLIRMTEEFREVASQLGYEKHTSLIDISSM